VVALGAVGGGVAFAAFSGVTTNPANTFSAAPDFVAPTAAGSVIMRNGGNAPGGIKQGAAYYVYASVSDTGNPSSGIGTVTADVSAITSGKTADPLATTGGPWTVAGTSYNYRSANVLTAGSPLSGLKSYSLALADNASNSATAGGYTVTADNTQPTASDIQGVPGGTAGAIDSGDKLVYTYSEAIDPTTIKAAWDGTSTAITVTITSANPGVLTTSANLGSVDLGQRAYSASSATFNATMTMSGSAVTVTLGTQTVGGSSRAMNASTLTWTPSASALDPAGNACTTTAKAETGGADADF
jgi:hypothetical protein